MIATAQVGYPQLSPRQHCALLGINRAWYYARQQEDRAAQTEATRLRDAIERLVLTFPGYGYRRVTKAFRRDGWAVDLKRVLRIMHGEALLCQPKRRFVVTTNATHGLPTYPNLLAGLAITQLDQCAGRLFCPQQDPGTLAPGLPENTPDEVNGQHSCRASSIGSTSDSTTGRRIRTSRPGSASGA